jgi:TM2 domain-containing membrane protein YozV
MSGMNIAPGYYQDGQGAMRWWDGQQWTPQVQLQQSGPPPLTENQLTVARNGKPQLPQGYVSAKNPGVAVLLSFFLPGAGNLYAGSTAAGVVLLICWFVSWLFMLVAIPAFLIVWIVGMPTAYGAAVKFNQRNGISVR